MKSIITFSLLCALSSAIFCNATSPTFWDSLDEDFARMEKEMHKLHSKMTKEMQKSFKDTDHVTVKKDKDTLFAHVDMQNRNVSVEEVGSKIIVTFPVGALVKSDNIDVVLEEPKGGEPYVRVSVEGEAGEQINATIEDRLVSVSIEQRVDHEKKDKKDGSSMVYVTSGMASVVQHRRLPYSVDISSVQSNLDNGKLTLSFDAHKPRKIEVKTTETKSSKRDKHAK